MGQISKVLSFLGIQSTVSDMKYAAYYMHVCSYKLGVSVRLSEFMFSGGCSDNVISLIWILIVGKDISGFRIRILS